MSSENSQGTQGPNRTNFSGMVDMTEDDVVTATSEKAANGIEPRPYSPYPGLAVILDAVVPIQAIVMCHL